MSASEGESLPLARQSVDRDDAGRAVPIAERRADPAARAVLLHRDLLLVDGPRLRLLPAGDAPEGLGAYLGRDAVGPLLGVIIDDATAAAIDGEWGSLRAIGHLLDARDAGLAVELLALANWHVTHRFSPRSGAPTEITRAGWVRVDADTGAELFPRTDPAVIVAVLDADDRLLLGSNAQWETSRFSLFAGFVEPGESLEAAVVREVAEEAGIAVVDPRYVGSQPWPYPLSLMLGFTARVAPGTDAGGRPDGEEIVELRWFTRDELHTAATRGEVRLPGEASIARALIERWYGGTLPTAAW